MNKLILSDFFTHFSQILGSGTPLLEALIKCGKKSYMKEHQNFISYLIDKVKSGQNLGQSLLNIGFPKEYIGYFNVGEWEGRLDQTMKELALTLKSDKNDDPAINLNISEKKEDRSSRDSEPGFPAPPEDGEYESSVKLVNGWIKRCVEAGASDLHIIPVKGGDAIIKYRINGVLQEIGGAGKEEFTKAVARIKFMACLDVAEKRLPQDGRILIKIGEKEADLRVSIVPSITGEKVTVKFLSKTEVIIGLDKIKLSKPELNEVKEMLKKPYGLILVTGMSGSGKTTTCYSILNDYVEKGCNVVTIEQPAEYLLNGATQIALDASIGLTGLAALKSAMRTDPDVIFIGEPSGAEIINYAIKAAQTGHVVVCQFFYKTIFELIDALLKIKDIDASAFANILNGAMAQTLLRKLCGCKKKSDRIPPAFLKKNKAAQFYISAGCEKCLNSGYKGRVPVYDILIFNRDVKEAIASCDIAEIKKLLTGSLEKKAVELVKTGITSVEEVNRVFGQII